jgi:hypothetical protein
MNDNQNSKDRHIGAIYDSRGNPTWRSIMSHTEDTSFAVCMMVPDRIIPVIFVPGVMGSNLKGKGAARDITWRLDGPKSMISWLGRDAAKRKEYLTPATMDVDNDGYVPEGTSQGTEELKRRGWGEIGAMSYAPFLVWLENALHDYDSAQDGIRNQLIGVTLGASKGEEALEKKEVALSYRYRFPVHACGYNWLDDNANSAKRLHQRIDEIIARYRREKKRCEKVIVVTHSMGGLVARHCSEVLGAKGKIFGIVHGVMPAIGAPAVYRRMKAGTENPGRGFKGWLEGHIGSKILGENAAEMTAVLSGAPGPLQLLPTSEYGNYWLKIKQNNGTEYSLPKSGDPYTEIYTVRGQWWSLCEDHLINPLNKENDPRRKVAQMDTDWETFSKIIDRKVEPFHSSIKTKYHPHTHVFYGSDINFLAYGEVIWNGGNIFGENFFGAEGRPPYPLQGRALNSSEIGTQRTIASPIGGKGWRTGVQQSYRIGDPATPGDGTVPHRSGIAPEPYVRSLLKVSVGHEPAYKNSEIAQKFTLRAIVKIAQHVMQTSLRYD